MKIKISNHFCAVFGFVAVLSLFAMFFAFVAAAQTSQICVPNEISGCKICNAAGTDWVNDNLKCATGQICVNGECVFNCRSECVVAGIKECRDGGYRVCVRSESTGCLHWSGIFPCSGGADCVAGICVKTTASVNSQLVLSKFTPSGNVNQPKIYLGVATNIAANCRYDALDRSFDLMPGNFATTNYLSHSAAITLEKPGNYVYYVSCRDKDGNFKSGKISFNYLAELIKEEIKTEVTQAPPLKQAPPIISALNPSGKIDSAQVEISLATDKSAVCNYDIFDTDYDSMENSLVAFASGLEHHHKIVLPNFGKYTYYVRCMDKSGNKNLSSAKISFEYVDSESGADYASGPKMENLSPAGVIYQNEIVLMIVTDEAAQCRYAESDGEFKNMSEIFTTSDGFFHEAMINLKDYGDYNYYVRCEGADGKTNGASQVISFQYQDPGAIDFPANAVASLKCSEYSLAEEDEICDYSEDCVCDPDCKKVGEYDQDCDHIAAPRKNTGGILLFGLMIAAGLAIIFAVIIFVSKKNKGNNEVAVTDESKFLG